MKTGLSPALLNAILERIGEKQSMHPMQVVSQSFDDLFERTPKLDDELNRLRHINHHLDYLEQEGFITVREKGRAFQRAWIELTSIGHKYLQPELAEFGQSPMLPAVVESLENRIAVLTYLEDEKEGMLYQLREAVAKGVPDVIAKVIVELANKILTGGT